MRISLKNIDEFSRNTVIVFVGTSLVNFFNLLFQLLVAHRLSASSFAAFNSLLSIFMIISSPLGTIQMAVAKYVSEFSVKNQADKVRVLLNGFIKKAGLLAIATFLLFWLISIHIMGVLRIHSETSGYILALLLGLSWLTPVLLGGIQGLELFGWFASIPVAAGLLKLALSFLFLLLGYDIAGALGALLASGLIALILYFFPLRHFIAAPAGTKTDSGAINYKEVFGYLFPVAVSYLCFFILVSCDVILVKYFFVEEKAGIYSLAQMVGKIFLFMPAAVSIVMFTKTSRLNAKNMDTTATLKRSILFVAVLSAITFFIYNLFPGTVLRVLTGKVYPESIFLGRLFSVSMTFFSLLNLLIAYFLSIKDFRFIKYLAAFTLLQVLGVVLFHKSLVAVQSLLCINAALLFFIHRFLINFEKASTTDRDGSRQSNNEAINREPSLNM